MKPIAIALLMCLVVASQAATPADLATQVRQLVDDTTRSSEAEARAFARLIELGSTAVPYIVDHLDDGRPLAERSIRLPPRPPSLHSRQRDIWYVHDGLVVVLREITGKSMDPANGHASASERAKIKRKWINWGAGKRGG
jgi:hypothetical protein